MRFRTPTTALCAGALMLAACGKNADTSGSSAVQTDAAAPPQEAPVPGPASLPAAVVSGQSVVYGKLGAQPLQGYFVTPAKFEGTLPGLIVFPDASGLDEHVRQQADQLAAQGYAVLAVDLYGGKNADTPDDAKRLTSVALKNPKALDRSIDAAYDYLKDSAKAGRIATLGWGFGGSVSFEAAQELSGKLAATVIGSGLVNDQPKRLVKLKAPVLALFGGKDERLPASTVAAFAQGLEAQGARPIVQTYPEAAQAYTDPADPAYRKADADDAWKRTLDFLGENLQNS